jgi:hypothetical protein
MSSEKTKLSLGLAKLSFDGKCCMLILNVVNLKHLDSFVKYLDRHILVCKRLISLQGLALFKRLMRPCIRKHEQMSSR